MTAGVEHADADGRGWLAAGSLTSVVLGLWLTAGVWGGRPQAGDDIQGQLSWNEFALSRLFAHGRADGWYPGFILGYDKFLHYGPGYTWLVAAVRVMTLGALSTTGAVKVVTVVSYVAVGPAVAFLARSLGFSRVSSGVAAVLALAVNSPFGLGLSGLYIIGLLPQQAAATWMLLTLGAAVRAWRTASWRWVLGTAAFGSMLVLTHPITVMVLAVVGGVAVLALLVDERPRPGRRGWAALLVVGALVVGWCSFWVLPYVAHRDLVGPLTSWVTPSIGDRLRAILGGHFLLHGPVGWVALSAMVVYVVVAVVQGDGAGSGHARFPLAAAAMAPGFLLVAHVAADVAPHSALGSQLANRGVGIAGVLALLPLAALLGGAVGWAAQRLAITGPASARVVAAGVPALALIAAVVLVVVPGTDRRLARQQPVPVPAMADAAAVLRREVPPTARFATERDFPAEIARTGLSHPDFWLARHSGRNTLNVFGVELTTTIDPAFVPEELGKVPPGQSANALARFGVTHVVTVRDSTADALAAVPGAFRLVWRSSPLAVFAVATLPDRPSPSALIAPVDPRAPLAMARLVRASRAGGGADGGAGEREAAEHMRIDVRADAPVAVTVAIGYSPKWHARIGGRPVAVSRSTDGLLALNLPAGATTLALDYRSDRWDTLGMAVSAATVLVTVGVCAWAWRRRRRSRDKGPGPSADEDQRTRVSPSSSLMSSSLSRTA